MVIISRSRTGPASMGHRKKMTAAVFLLIGSITLLSLGAITISVQDSISIGKNNNSLRGIPQLRQPQSWKRSSDDVRSIIELDVNNAILTFSPVENEQILTVIANKKERLVAMKETDSSVDIDGESIIATATPAANEGSTTTASSTIPIIDMLFKRSLQVKQLIRDQFSGSNSPPNPRYTIEPTTSATRTVSCDQEDAFAGVPIDDGKHHAWVPNPTGGYSSESRNKWEKSFNGAMKRIHEEAAGGDKLREFAAREVRQLRSLRHSLFCKKNGEV